MMSSSPLHRLRTGGASGSSPGSQRWQAAMAGSPTRGTTSTWFANLDGTAVLATDGAGEAGGPQEGRPPPPWGAGIGSLGEVPRWAGGKPPGRTVPKGPDGL